MQIKEVDETSLNQFLSVYHPHFRFLTSVHIDTDNRVGYGTFEFPPENLFLASGMRTGDHIVTKEVQQCMTVLMYPFMKEMLTQVGVGKMLLDERTFFKLMKHGVVLDRVFEEYYHYLFPSGTLEGSLAIEDVKEEAKDGRDITYVWFRGALLPDPQYREHEEPYNDLRYRVGFYLPRTILR